MIPNGIRSRDAVKNKENFR